MPRRWSGCATSSFAPGCGVKAEVAAKPRDGALARREGIGHLGFRHLVDRRSRRRGALRDELLDAAIVGLHERDGTTATTPVTVSQDLDAPALDKSAALLIQERVRLTFRI